MLPCLLAPNPPSSPLNLYFKCTRSLVRKQTFPPLPRLRTGPGSLYKPCPSEEGAVATGSGPPTSSLTPSLFAAEGILGLSELGFLCS